MSKIGKPKETESRFVFAKDSVAGMKGFRMTAKGNKVSFSGNENILRLWR